MPTRKIHERSHRLPRAAYQGMVDVSFTACVDDFDVLFDSARVVLSFLDILARQLTTYGCSAYVYCFMPDHLHVITHGEHPLADAWAAMAAFKQSSGYWLAQDGALQRWQKDFWDHVVRSDEDLGRQIQYVADNPVRRGLVRHWHEYPFTGAIGHDLGEILVDAARLARRDDR